MGMPHLHLNIYIIPNKYNTNDAATIPDAAFKYFDPTESPFQVSLKIIYISLFLCLQQVLCCQNIRMPWQLCKHRRDTTTRLQVSISRRGMNYYIVKQHP